MVSVSTDSVSEVCAEVLLAKQFDNARFNGFKRDKVVEPSLGRFTEECSEVVPEGVRSEFFRGHAAAEEKRLQGQFDGATEEEIGGKRDTGSSIENKLGRNEELTRVEQKAS